MCSLTTLLCHLLVLFVLLSQWSVGRVLAEEDGHLRFITYGTLGFSHDDTENIAVLRDLSQRASKRNQTNDSWVIDSRLGLQASYQFSSFVDAMAQMVWREQVDTSPNSYLDWAFINLHPTPAFDVRLGRVGYDVFLISDHRNLGYAYPWIHPPIEFYGWVPMYSVNGGDIAYSLEDGLVRWRFKVQAGRGGLKFPMGQNGPDYDFKSDNVRSLIIERESNFWRIKGGYSQFTIKTEAPILVPLQAGLAAVAGMSIPEISEESADLLRELTYKGVTLRYTNLGVTYDNGSWLGQAELGRVTTTADVVSNGNMAYIGIGRRFGNFTPFVLLSEVRSNAPVRQALSNWSSLGLSGLGLQNTAVSVLNSTRFAQKTGSMGLRWDLNSRLALKMQWDSTHVHPNGYGLLNHDDETQKST